jgi:hypothetical protein
MELENLVEGQGSHPEKNLMELENLVEGPGSHPENLEDSAPLDAGYVLVAMEIMLRIRM